MFQINYDYLGLDWTVYVEESDIQSLKCLKELFQEIHKGDSYLRSKMHLTTIGNRGNRTFGFSANYKGINLQSYLQRKKEEEKEKRKQIRNSKS